MRRVLGLPDMNAIMHRLYVDELSPAEIAALAPLLLAAARADDPPALALLRGGCADLAECSWRSPRAGLETGECEVVLVGGLVQNNDLYAETLRGAIRQRLPSARCREPECRRLRAAVLALRQAEIAIDGPRLQAMRDQAGR